MSIISLPRLRTAPQRPSAPTPAPQQSSQPALQPDPQPTVMSPPRPLLDRWFLAWAEKAEARWLQPGYPHSRYY